MTADHECAGINIIGGSRVTDADLAARALSGLGKDQLRRGVVGTYESADLTSESRALIVASENDTTVTITPKAALRPGPDLPGSPAANVPFQVTLDAHEMIHLAGIDSGANADLTGTLVTSNKPVAVMGANQCDYIPGTRPTCDTLIEMMPPTSSYGTRFVKAAYHFRHVGDITRVVAATDGTEVSVDGVPVATLDRGEFYERDSAVESFEVIDTSEPALAAMFEKGVEEIK